MSTLSYEQLYQQILGELNELQQEDVAIGSQRLPETIKEKNTFYTQFFLALYVKYLTISRKLVVIYDTQLQPQKLGEVRMLLDSCLGRMLELKEALVKNSGDYILLDNVMLDLKLSPESLEPPVPSYILEDRKEEIQRQRNYIASLQEHYAESDPECLLSVAKKMLKTWRKDPTKLPPTDSATAPAAEGSAEERPCRLWRQ
ncbi:hypothetical protein AGDE_14301 [Angomonas deanei]|uniref:Uncharacterized protein n=1 Tax=Angomonas deanei TaxID=59799 RepID=A0A7G2CKR6_9TRYP|nr:hypothetical protein AGDE_14301 [Angomonas deanei]CAD2219667.1 hypothetical protein, conserved [Angomonas deanei]|eukprot:EPY21077.1 hypothetical protein AGDE_14301 [Angomonas deanei]